ncbi:exocyst complex component EXO70B1-like [Glycine soja]|uniref:exocyst complex component EXO70B1-like n=1 Tax=Glycine soja TaxID=3848 RepID=UPI00103B386C|nr:exocyst complex component EXO70B1-like [Glycine soja]
MLIEIQSWLRQPKVWRFVCFISSVVGLLCYALSSSFNHMFGKWSWWKILLYIVFSCIICIAVLFAKAWESSNSLRLEAHTAFLVLMITSVYSFFVDKVVKGKPDACSLVSCAAFAIMSLCLSRLSRFGFEVDLLYFFSSLLTIQLMKIKVWLVFVGGCFSYSLIKLRSTLDSLLIHGDLVLQVIDQDIESGSLSSEINSSASQLDSPQAIITSPGNANALAGATLENKDLAFLVAQVRSDSHQSNSNSNSHGDDRQFYPLLPFNHSSLKDKSWRPEKMNREWVQLREQRASSLIELLENQIEVLKKKNGSIIGAMSKHVDRCLKTNLVYDDQIPVPQIDHDDNLVVDALQFDDDDNIVGDLGATARLMVMAGIEEECCRVYCCWRREFLNESLSTFGLQVQDLNMEDIDNKEKIQCSIKALNVFVRLLFPNERRLCHHIFGKFISSADFAFTEVCRESATRLLSTADALANSFRNTFEELMYEFELVFSGEYSKSIKKDARSVQRSLDIFKDSENLLTCGSGGLLPITHELMKYISDNAIETKSRLNQASQGMLSPSVQVARIARLFERSLKANSKNYNNPSLGYVFILNNRSYIDRHVDPYGLGPIGYDWLQKNKRKIEKNYKLYLTKSWTKIFNFLKLDINEAEANVAVKLMTDKLRSFNQHFDDICNDQSTWLVFDKQLREQIIKSIENILLLAYGNFIGRLQDLLGNHANEYIKYGMIDVQDRLNNLFLVRE